MRSTRFTVPTADELAALARVRQSDVASLLLPPGPSPEAHLTLRNLVKDVEHDLAPRLRAADVARRMAPVYRLLDDHDVWAVPTVSMALYAGDGEFHAAPGPAAGEPLAVVAPRFHIAHLLGVAPAQRYAVLVLTRGTSHLYRGRGSEITESTSGGLPAEMAEVLRYDDREPQLQSHGSARRGGGTVVAAFHGQGGRGDHPEDVARYLRFVAAEVEEVLGGEPLVLAATTELASAFRRISGYAAIEDEVVSGNAEHLSPAVLAQHAGAVLDASEASRMQATIEQFAAQLAAGSLVTDLGEIITAAHDGRVQRLGHAADRRLWGRYDPAERRIVDVAEDRNGAEGTVDLINEAAVETWLHGGDVLAVPEAHVPGNWHLAATLRF